MPPLSPAVKDIIDGPPYSTQGEVWKPHPHYPVEVSNCGRVRQGTNIVHLSRERSGFLLAQFKTPDGWKKVRAHQLVADAFIAPRHPLSTLRVLHRDLNRSNNVPENLRYGTPAEIAQYHTLLACAAMKSNPRAAVEDSFSPAAVVPTPDGVYSEADPPAVLSTIRAVVSLPGDGSEAGGLYPSDEESAAIFAETAALYAASRRSAAPSAPDALPAPREESPM